MGVEKAMDVGQLLKIGGNGRVARACDRDTEIIERELIGRVEKTALHCRTYRRADTSCSGKGGFTSRNPSGLAVSRE